MWQDVAGRGNSPGEGQTEGRGHTGVECGFQGLGESRRQRLGRRVGWRLPWWVVASPWAPGTLSACSQCPEPLGTWHVTSKAWKGHSCARVCWAGA